MLYVPTEENLGGTRSMYNVLKPLFRGNLLIVNIVFTARQYLVLNSWFVVPRICEIVHNDSTP